MWTIDFETRSEVDITKTGAWVYSTHPSTQVLCLAYVKDDEEECKYWLPYEDPPSDLLEGISKGDIVEAHNVFFERSIWSNILSHWPQIPDSQWRCSASKASFYTLPRALEKVAKVLQTPIQKNMDGHRLMLKMSKPRKPTKNNPVRWHSKISDYVKLLQYCIDDVLTEREVSKKLSNLNTSELAIWQLDQKINLRGVRVDSKAINKALSFLDIEKKNFDRQIFNLTNGSVSSISKNQQLKNWCLTMGEKIDSFDKRVIHHRLPSVSSPKVKKALEIREKASKTSAAKYQAIHRGTDSDDRLRDLYMYNATRTGRWAGRRVQPHNFPRNNFKGDLNQFYNDLETLEYPEFSTKYPNTLNDLSQCARGIFIPSENHTFYGGDFKGIELRMAFWLTNDRFSLKEIQEGVDQYIELAKQIYGKDAINQEERSVGKVGMLSGIYGVGANRFRKTLADSYKINIDQHTAESSIQSFRWKYPRIVRAWKGLEDTAKQAIEKKQAFEVLGSKWFKHGGFLYCKLPSGRCQTYFDPQILDWKTPWGKVQPTITYMSQNSITRKWERTHTYGGKLFENVVSGICRDILAGGMLRCWDKKYYTVLHTHDENVTEAENGSLAEYVELMTIRPDWCKDFPLELSGWMGDRYLK